MNELNYMREQLVTLKKQLDTQAIINDRLIKEAMSGKLSSINRRAIIICVLCAIYIPLGFLIFYLLGTSIHFCCATSLFFLVSMVAVIFSHIRLRQRDIRNGDLVTTYKAVARMRRIYKVWHYFSIPPFVVWFAWLEYEIYLNVVDRDTTALMAITISAVIGGVIGGAIGLRNHRRTLREAEDILRQIEELQKVE